MEKIKACIQQAQDIHQQLAELEKNKRTNQIYSNFHTDELLKFHTQLQSIMDEADILGIVLLDNGTFDVQLDTETFFSIVGQIEPYTVRTSEKCKYTHYRAVVEDIHFTTVKTEWLEHKKAQAI